jgi:hypothetical protein
MSTTTARRNAARNKAEARRRARRRQILTIVGSSVAVLAVVAVIVVVAAVGGGGSKDTTGAGRTSGIAALAGVTGVPAATLEQVGPGTTTALPQRVDEPAITRDGKPLVLYVGAEYCPYCAAQRWPFVQAMSRFGTWSNLDLTRSAADDVFPNTPTFTFHGATFTSEWLSFSGKELYTSEVRGDGYVPLDKLTAEEERLFTSHTQAFPFIDLGGHFIINGSSYKPEVLDGLTALGIAEAMSDPSHPVAKGVDGSANVITAALCHVTGGQPANVCTAPPVAAITRAMTR